MPYVFVRGNHDSASTQAAVASQKNAVVLDDRVATVAGLTIAGIGDPRFTPVEGSAAPDRPEAVAADTQLAGTIRAYDAAHPDDPVDFALVHDPTAADPLAGIVPAGAGRTPAQARGAHRRRHHDPGRGHDRRRADHLRRAGQGR